MRQAKRPKTTTVRSMDEIPAFASEDAEREWWATHDLSEELYDKLKDASDEKKPWLRAAK